MAVQDRTQADLANYFSRMDAAGSVAEPNAPQMPWWGYFMPAVSGLGGLAGAAIGGKRKGPAVGRGMAMGREAMGMMEKAIQADYMAKVRQAEVKRQKAQQMLDNKYRTIQLAIASGDTSGAKKMLQAMGLPESQTSIYLKNPILSKVSFLPLSDLTEQDWAQFGTMAQESDFPWNAPMVQLALQRKEMWDKANARPPEEQIGPISLGWLTKQMGVQMSPEEAADMAQKPMSEALRALGLVPGLGQENITRMAASIFERAAAGGEISGADAALFDKYALEQTGDLMQNIGAMAAFQNFLVSEGHDTDMILEDGTKVPTSQFAANLQQQFMAKMAEKFGEMVVVKTAAMTPEQLAEQFIGGMLTTIQNQGEQK